METKNIIEPDNKPLKAQSNHNRAGRVMGGLFIVAIGLLLFARQVGVDVPRWLFSFEAILIAAGVYLGFRHSFRGLGWMIPIVIGLIFLIDDFYHFYEIRDFALPILIITIGLFMIFRAGKKNHWKNRERSHMEVENVDDDYLDSTVIFGGVKKTIISKNFKGGEAVTVFGGTEINLTQADVSGAIVVDLTQIFGGTKLIVPAHWRVQSQDLVAIFGGIDDKRPPVSTPGAHETAKVLILKGTCLLGGIEIRSY